ncbi:MAG: crossover junction endodeoxyribonuclease RuvC [Thermodesulfobacteriota bacterium]|nr:crossover junction endodeoxyribonuclease RuvC [Thermodesulfobacteriota bacterium]
MIKIIGIDPGLADTGIGIIHGRDEAVAGYSYGHISTSKADPLPCRLDRIYSVITDLLASEKPDLMVLEDVFSLKAYPLSGITLGQVTGVILLAGQRAGISVVRIPVREVKQVMTGNGNAGKQQLAEAIRRILEHEGAIRPDHASDALALALVGMMRYDRLS